MHQKIRQDSNQRLLGLPPEGFNAIWASFDWLVAGG
jgi:hypothetical protein